MSDIAIKVTNVSKTFKLPHEKHGSIKSMFVNIFSLKKSYEKQQVLEDISFEVEKGEFFGIVGRNGSGKSTLLKLLAGIYSPDTGAIQVKGKLTPFIELGVGFNMELTGRENVFLNGALLGFNRAEMQSMYDDIVAFAELEKFMDQKLKNYSSGMQVRLAFSIAIRARTPILLLDEVLAVGDEAFQKKCIDVFELYKAEKQTIVLVTHDMETVRRFCTKAMLIDKGKIVEYGEPNHVAAKYSRLNRPTLSDAKDSNKEGPIKVILRDEAGKKTNMFSVHEKLCVEISWPEGIGSVQNAGLAIIKNSGEYIFGSNTLKNALNLKGNKAFYDVQLSLDPGKYYVMVGLFGKNKDDVIEFLDHGEEFIIEDEPDDRFHGIARLQHNWSTKRD